MGKIFCIVGKSASGKDTIYKEIVKKYKDRLSNVVIYTTRPKREGEENGVDYNFVTEDELLRLEKKGLVIEKRCYNTTQGIWTYFTLDFKPRDDKDYILINTLEGAKSISRYYGSDKVFVVYLSVDDKTRLLRYIDRESKQKNPDYAEVCRRFIADQKDFSEENIKEIKNLHYINSGDGIEESINQWDILFKKKGM